MLPIDIAFEAVNLWMLAWWVIWIVAPQSRLARWVTESRIPIFLPVAIYCFFLIPSLPEIGPILVRPQLTPIQNLLGTQEGTFTGWVHFLVMDFLVGQWVLCEGLSQNRSPWLLRILLFLTLMLGPIGGFLSFVLLKNKPTKANA